MMEVSKEYARAVFMLATENESVESYLESLLTVRDIITENPDYISFLASPAITLSERLDAIDTAFSGPMPQYVVDFIKLLCTNGRASLLGECIDEFEELVRNAASEKVAKVSYVFEPSDEQKAALEAKLGKLYNCKIDAQYIKDESLIGGLRVEIDGDSLDYSVAKRLKRAEEVMYNE